MKVESLEDEESKQAIRNMVFLINNLSKCGFVELRPQLSQGSPFQDPLFVVPEPMGEGKDFFF